MEEIIENIKIQLEMLGYKIKDTDKTKIEYLTKKHISQIMYICRLEEVQEPLSYVVADKVCAELLKNKIALEEEIGIAIGNNVKNIKIGDVTVDFPNNSSNEEKLSLILEKLERKDFDYSPYAKMRW